ncbi:hypothetical protein [Bacillus smithii]
MENKSALKKHLCQLEQMLLKPEIRSTDDFFESGKRYFTQLDLEIS